MSVSIIIPTYNGLALLQKNLPALLAAEQVEDAELLIADDGSTDGTQDWLAVNVPQARVIRRDSNGGFSLACNSAIEAASGDSLLLLNNDVAVTPGFLPPLRDALASGDGVFAVNSKILLPSRDLQDEGDKTGWFHNGVFYVDCLATPPTTSRPTFYATACSALYSREKVKLLGGFCSLFSPFYWEDVDLSYRALRRGWKILYEPGSVVYHQHETTTSVFDTAYKSRIRERNQFLFVWKNVTDPRMTLLSLALGPCVGFRKALGRAPSLWEGYWAALRLWSQIRPLRRREKLEALVSDRSLLKAYAAPRDQVGRT